MKRLLINQGVEMSEYKKICYWTDVQGLNKISQSLREKGFELGEEVRIPCRVLRKSTEVAYVVPLAWEGFCRRRTSWYLNSEKAGKFLVVSNGPLNHSDLGSPIRIMNSDFMPDRLPTHSEAAELAQSRIFQRAKPQPWDKPHPFEKDFYQRWFEKNRVNKGFDFEKILLSHSANHANFIDPKFFIDLDGRKVPYSIADSLHVCSSCLEFFNILGSQWPVKYIVPCIGAVQFARLAMNRYLKVESG